MYFINNTKKTISFSKVAVLKPPNKDLSCLDEAIRTLQYVSARVAFESVVTVKYHKNDKYNSFGLNDSMWQSLIKSKIILIQSIDSFSYDNAALFSIKKMLNFHSSVSIFFHNFEQNQCDKEPVLLVTACANESPFDYSRTMDTTVSCEIKNVDNILQSIEIAKEIGLLNNKRNIIYVTNNESKHYSELITKISEKLVSQNFEMTNIPLYEFSTNVRKYIDSNSIICTDSESSKVVSRLIEIATLSNDFAYTYHIGNEFIAISHLQNSLFCDSNSQHSLESNTILLSLLLLALDQSHEGNLIAKATIDSLKSKITNNVENLPQKVNRKNKKNEIFSSVFARKNDLNIIHNQQTEDITNSTKMQNIAKHINICKNAVDNFSLIKIPVFSKIQNHFPNRLVKNNIVANSRSFTEKNSSHVNNFKDTKQSNIVQSDIVGCDIFTESEHNLEFLTTVLHNVNVHGIIVSRVFANSVEVINTDNLKDTFSDTWVIRILSTSHDINVDNILGSCLKYIEMLSVYVKILSFHTLWKNGDLELFSSPFGQK